jgi:hypothetical protein
MAEMAERQRPGPQITDEDVQAAVRHSQSATFALCPNPRELVARAALESALRPGGLVARAIADELERLASGFDRTASQIRGDYHEAQAARDAYENAAERARDAAAECREGKR